jgi:hypothetical protein
MLFSARGRRRSGLLDSAGGLVSSTTSFGSIRSVLVRGKIALLVLLLWMAVGRVSAAQPTDSTAQLRQLAERVLGHDDEVTFLIGAVPDSVQSVVPLPNAARVLGTVRRSSPVPQRPSQLKIYADVEASPSAVLKFYAERLPEAGWTAPERGRRARSGFVPPEARFPNRYCRGDDTLLLIRPSAPEARADASGGRTHLELRYLGLPKTDRRSPCRRGGERRRPDRGTDRLLPEMALPEFASAARGPRWPDTIERSQVMVVADTSAHALHEAFAAQLRTAGWERANRGGDERVRWSDWRIPQETGTAGRGHLTIEAIPLADGFSATVLARPSPEPSR